VHDVAFLRFPSLLTEESQSYYGQINRAVQNAEHVIAVSESTKRDLISLVGADEKKITVVYEAAGAAFRPADAAAIQAVRQLESRLNLSGFGNSDTLYFRQLFNRSHGDAFEITELAE
jgi:hypothetical protein